MNRLTWIGILLLALLSAATGQRLLFLMSLILALLAGSAQLWSRYCLVGVSYRRRFDQNRLFYGDDTRMDVEIVNAKPLPLGWLRIDDEFPFSMHPQNDELDDPSQATPNSRRRLVNVLSLRWYERVIRRYTLKGARRGLWHFGPAQIRSGDMFGFDIQRMAYDSIDTLLVYPKIVSLEALGLPAGHPFGDFTSRRRLVEDPLRLMGTRAYAPGDSYRHIHWKATARRQSLQTKVFEPSATLPVAIFLNLNTYDPDHVGLFGSKGQDYPLVEFAITTAASVARFVWQEGHPVGLYANALLLSLTLAAEEKIQRTVGRVRVAPRNHPDQLVRILEALARIEGRARWSFPTLLHVESSGLAYGTTVVVITSVLEPKLAATLTDLNRKGYSVVLIGLGHARLSSPIPGVTDYYIGSYDEWSVLETIQPIFEA
ncbi:MAG: DUF58 domain-containing protein [Chloroflexota bacterium]